MFALYLAAKIYIYISIYRDRHTSESINNLRFMHIIVNKIKILIENPQKEGFTVISLLWISFYRHWIKQHSQHKHHLTSFSVDYAFVR